MSVAHRRSFLPLSTPPAGFPKYRLESAAGATIQDWTNTGVTQRTDSTGAAALCYYVSLSLDPSLWYTILWDAGDGSVTAEDFSGSAPQSGDAYVGGTGSVEVTSTYNGLDLAVETAAGAGIAGATVRAYLAAEFAAGTYVVRGRATTDMAGAWRGLYLDPDTYKLSIVKPGSYAETLVDLTVVAP